MSSVWRSKLVYLWDTREDSSNFQQGWRLVYCLLPRRLFFLCVVLFRLLSHSTPPAKAEEWELIKWEWKTTTIPSLRLCSSFLHIYSLLIHNMPHKFPAKNLITRTYARTYEYVNIEPVSEKCFWIFPCIFTRFCLLSYFSFSPFSILINI